MGASQGNHSLSNHLFRIGNRYGRSQCARHKLVYFCSEHIEDAEASRGARVWWLLAHDINSELHLLAVDVQRCDRSTFRGPIKVVRERSS